MGEVAGHGPDKEERRGLAERAGQREDRPSEHTRGRIGQDVAPDHLPPCGADAEAGLADPSRNGTERLQS